MNWQNKPKRAPKRCTFCPGVFFSIFYDCCLYFSPDIFIFISLLLSKLCAYLYHLTFKIAPICAKTHIKMIGNSVCKFPTTQTSQLLLFLAACATVLKGQPKGRAVLAGFGFDWPGLLLLLWFWGLGLGRFGRSGGLGGLLGGCYIAAHYVINIFWSKPSNACGSQAQQKMCQLVPPSVRWFSFHAADILF